jgi:hypothetical protein
VVGLGALETAWHKAAEGYFVFSRQAKKYGKGTPIGVPLVFKELKPLDYGRNGLA